MSDIKNMFIGTWDLVSCTYLNDNGQEFDFMGPNPKGILIYTTETVAAQFMNAQRKRLSTEDWINAPLPEIKEAYLSYQAYFGRYQIDAEQQKIVHLIDASLFPNWHIDQVEEIRFFILEGNTLTLKTQPIFIDGTERVFVATWTKKN